MAAAAWDAEQDGRLHESNVDTLHKQLDNVESCIAGIETEIPEGQQTPRKAQLEAPAPIQSSSNDAHLESLSSDILSDLTSTVSSLRLRHTEYRHLIQLSTSRLEAVAQRCIAQERAIRDLNSELQNLRNENNILGKESEDSQVEIQQLKAEVASKDVAMEAMAGAVSGLEGWIENTLPPTSPVALHNEGARRGKKKGVIRGRGRFRGRYYVDEHPPGGHHGIDIEARDLHDGVKAWLRGFRDVEEGVRARRGISGGRQSNLYGNLKDRVVEEEWGDFESAP